MYVCLFLTIKILEIENIVTPILDYGSGVWATKSFSKLQTVQNKAIRTFLGVHRFAANVAIQGDMGWESCALRQKINVLRLWCRLIMMSPTRLTKRIFLWDYELSLNGTRNWSYRVNQLLHETDMEAYYENIFTPLDTTSFIQECRKIFKHSESTQWQTDIEKYSKLRTYRNIKIHFGTEKYLTCLLSTDMRSVLAQLRCGILPLKIETGRFSSPFIPAERRICDVCHKEIEDEVHFLFKCPLYNLERVDWCYDLSQHIDLSNSNKHLVMQEIFENKFAIKRTAYYIKACLCKRSNHLSS